MKLNTFSIIAVDKASGCLGGAAASYYPGLGAFSPYIRSRTAIVASQGWTNPLLSADIADLVANGATAKQALMQALGQDSKPSLRQVSVVTYDGQAAVISGADNDDYYGQIIGVGYVIAGNLLAGAQVLERMQEAYLGPGSFSERLLAALIAGDEAGGDKRGKKAAVLRVENEPGFPFIDFRVDDSEAAVADLAQIFRRNYAELQAAYQPWVESILTNYQSNKRS